MSINRSKQTTLEKASSYIFHVVSYPSGGAHCHVSPGLLAKHLKKAKIRYRTRTATRAIFAKTVTSYTWFWLSNSSAFCARSSTAGGGEGRHYASPRSWGHWPAASTGDSHGSERLR